MALCAGCGRRRVRATRTSLALLPFSPFSPRALSVRRIRRLSYLTFGCVCSLPFQIRQLQSEIKQTGTRSDGRDVGTLVWRINKLRRALAWVGSKWAFLLDERRTPPPLLRSPEPGELPLEVNEVESARSAETSGTVTPSEATKKTSSATDGSIGKLMATDVGAQRTSEGAKLSAPSLRADLAVAQEAGGEEVAQNDDDSVPASEGRKLRLIPTGLVARYVAMFQENASQTQHSWRGPDWATAIRTRAEGSCR